MKPHLRKVGGTWCAELPPGTTEAKAVGALTRWCMARHSAECYVLSPRTLVVAQYGLPHVDIITCDSVQEARELVTLACSETVGGCQ